MTTSIEAAKAAILKIAQAVVSEARIEAVSTGDLFSCVVVVPSDPEKLRINRDPELLSSMKAAANKAGRTPDYLTAESQETVDRRFGGDWQAVWR